MDLPSSRDNRFLRRRWEVLLLLLALLLSFACVFFATWLALSLRPKKLSSANMLATSQANYGGSSQQGLQFAPIDPRVAAEAATDVAYLSRTPDRPGAAPAAIGFLPYTPTPTLTPTPTPTAPSAARPSVPAPIITLAPAPTSPPTATWMPTVTATPSPVPTGTFVPTITPSRTPPPTATAIVIPTNTSPPPTATRGDTSTPEPPPPATDRPPPTSTPTDTPIPPTPTDTPIPPTPTPPPPAVLAMVPNTQVNTGTLTANITGLNFQAGCTATLVSTWTGNVPLSVTWISTTTAVADVPADVPVGDFPAGYYGLTLTNPDGLSGSLASAYTATNPIPVITAVDPAVSLATSSDLGVTISGNNFRNTGAPGALGADLNGIPLANITYVSATELDAIVPFSSPGLDLGPYTLTVRNPGPTSPSGQLVNAFSVYAYSTTCEPAAICGPALEPDGLQLDLAIGAVITIDFGIGNGITDGPGYDMVYYEWPADIGGGVGGILLDMVRIELIDETAPYSSYIVFDWDESSPVDIAGTNIDSYAAGGEMDNTPIPAVDLYPGPSTIPWNTGIAIDIGIAAQAVQPPQSPLPGGGRFRWVRITSLPGGAGDTAQIDGVVRLH